MDHVDDIAEVVDTVVVAGGTFTALRVKPISLSRIQTPADDYKPQHRQDRLRLIRLHCLCTLLPRPK